MNFVDYKDNIAKSNDLGNETFYSCLKLTAKLRSGDKRRKIEKIYLFVKELCWDVLTCNFLRKSFGNSRFAYAGLADENGIILRSSVEYPNNSCEFYLSSDYGIELSFLCIAGKIDSVLFKDYFLFLSGLFCSFPLFYYPFFPQYDQIADSGRKRLRS